ncbi:MAG: hypothetical protein U0793_07875 [Gemmataceae bacterium]
MALKLSRRSWIILTLAGLMVVGLAAGAFLLKHEPSFYRRADVETGPERKMLSTACLGRFTQLVGCLQDGSGDWDIKMSQGQLNSFFKEDFVRLGVAEDFGRHGVSGLRVVFEGDKMRIGFRYGSGVWSTVVSYDLKLWLTRDVNVVAVEVLSRRAGALPLPLQSLLKEIADVARKRNIDITWYRHEGNPVALVRFQADRARPSFQLKHVEVADGMITIAGRSLEPLQPIPDKALSSLR